MCSPRTSKSHRLYGACGVANSTLLTKWSNAH
jgi:hypothetical protein